MTDTALEAFNRRNLRAAQLRQLDMLSAIDGICRRHGIGYWLDGGTLLGAVRHGGFIPWDDDIDIAMHRDDAARFETIAQEELPEGMFMQTRRTDPSVESPIAKVRDLNSLLLEDGDNLAAPYHKGLFIDIFPFEECPTTGLAFTKAVAQGISKAHSILSKAHHYSLRAGAELLWFSLRLAALRCAWAAAKAVLPCDTFMANIPENNGYGIKHRRDSILPLGSITFEGREFMAPANPDAYLRDLYGDYTKLPPEEKRRGHAVLIVPRLDTNTGMAERASRRKPAED